MSKLTGWPVRKGPAEEEIEASRLYFRLGVAAGGFVPYPNPRYALTAGMQTMDGGV